MTEHPLIVAPSILSADFTSLSTEIESVEQAGADWLHIDVMDGQFVPPISFGPVAVSAAKKCSALFRDVHLMIADPGRQIDAFADAGSNRITIHVEASPHCHRLLGAIRARGVENGLAINPGTPIEAAFPLLDICDLVLVMTVNPGWGGQDFIPNSVERIKSLKREIDSRGLTTRIEVDGGINEATAKKCREAGASALVAGSYIFSADDRAAAIQELRS